MTLQQTINFISSYTNADAIFSFLAVLSDEQMFTQKSSFDVSLVDKYLAVSYKNDIVKLLPLA
ncbi:MAG: hypothetical protein KDH96_04365 [Candidatus Riesia sp.]|nr:hypothetical protein [Candidatus Riesia sp.]